MNIEKFPKVTVILRGYTYSQTRTVVKNLVGTCLGSVEITMNTPGALESARNLEHKSWWEPARSLLMKKPWRPLRQVQPFCCLPRYLKSAYWTCAGSAAWCLYRGLFHLRKSDRVFWTGRIL